MKALKLTVTRQKHISPPGLTVVRRRAAFVVVRLRYREQTLDHGWRFELILSYPAADGHVVQPVLALDGFEVFRLEELVVDAAVTREKNEVKVYLKVLLKRR